MISSNKTRSFLLRLTAITLIAGFTASSFLTIATFAQKKGNRRRPSICGNPTEPCKSAVTFAANDLPFRVREDAIMWDTDLFYSVMLKSVPVPADNCDKFVPESERLAAQALFPNRKVFSSRCAEPGNLFYTNTGSDTQFMAVYAGARLADANAMLARVKASGKYPGANIRRMRTGFNGT